MFLRAWRIRKNRLQAEQFQELGESSDGWGPTLEVMRQGRGEFVGHHESASDGQVHLVCEVYWDLKTKEPRSFEVMIVKEGNQPASTEELLEEIEGIWDLEHFETLADLLKKLEFQWLSPKETFEYIYR